MSSVGLIYYRVTDTNSGDIITSSEVSGSNGIYSDIFSAFGSISKVTLLGIQAPAGTKVVINGNKNILIGRTGIYLLNDKTITSLYFERPISYKRDTTAEEKAITEGRNAILAAEATRTAALAELDSTASDYITKYNKIQEDYNAAYLAALAKYLEGKSGIYIVDTTVLQDLENVIVDFIYE